MIDYGMDLELAFHHPRLDESARGVVTLDGRLSADLARLMGKIGPVEMGASNVFSLLFGCANAVMREGAMNISMGR